MTHRYRLDLVDEAEGDADGRAVETIAWLRSRGYRIEDPPDLATRLRRRSRDDFLVQALGHMPSDTPRKKCRELAAAIARFEGTTWIRWRDHGTPPGGSRGISTVESCLFEARRLGRLPSTPEQLWNIVAKFNGRCNLVGEPLSSAPDPE